MIQKRKGVPFNRQRQDLKTIAICQRLAEGMTITEISKSYRLSQSSIWERLHRMQRLYSARTRYQLIAVLVENHQISTR